MKAKPSTDEEMVDKLDGILFDVPHSNDPRVYSDGYDILDMIEGYENKAREILKLGGYPLTVREIIHSRFDKDGMSLGKKPLPRKIRDAMDMLQSFHMVRVHIKENDISFALGFMAYGVHAAARLQIRPLKPLIDMGASLRKTQSIKGSKLKNVRGLTPSERQARNEKIKESRNSSKLSLNSFAKKEAKKHGLSPSAIKKIINKPLLSS